jgi:hypothetical protein
MISAISNLVTKLQEKKQQDAKSSADTFIQLVINGVDGKLTADQLEQGLALTGHSVEQFQEFAAAVVRRRELNERVKKGDRATAEMAHVDAAKAAADAELQKAVEKHKAAMEPLKAKVEELQADINNGDHGRKLLIESAGKLNPAGLQPHIDRRRLVYEQTEGQIAELSRKRGELSVELHGWQLSGSHASTKEVYRVEPLFKAAAAELDEAEKPRRDADAKFESARLSAEMI